MENINIEDIWSNGYKTEPEIESMDWPVKNPKRKSKQLVDRIKQTARREQVAFLVVVGIAIPVLLILGYYKVLLGVVLFTVLITWKYLIEIKLVDGVQLQEDTLAYLKGVRDLIKKFMSIYKNGILILTPLAMMSALLISNSLRGVGVIETMSEAIFWGVVTFSSVLSIVLSRLWLKLWVNTFYGKKLKELDQMIVDLEETK